MTTKKLEKTSPNFFVRIMTLNAVQIQIGIDILRQQNMQKQRITTKKLEKLEKLEICLRQNLKKSPENRICFV